jgi:hypothetical protein
MPGLPYPPNLTPSSPRTGRERILAVGNFAGRVKNRARERYIEKKRLEIAGPRGKRF